MEHHRALGRLVTERFFAPCPRGLEALLADEIAAVGGSDIAATLGGVAFAGPFDLCYRVNLESRLASRVLWLVAHQPYRTEQDIYRLCCDLRWTDWFLSRHTIKVKVSARQSPLKSLEFVTLRVKDAVCDTFRTRSGRRPTVETSRPDIRIDVFLDANTVTFYLDTSGEALFKRGWGKVPAEAPLRENLAAGLLKLAGWAPGTVLLDPMCGSGTILIEAAQMALDVAPGLRRRFAFEKLNNFNEKAWHGLRRAAADRKRTATPCAIFGLDDSDFALETARGNLAGASVAGAVQVAKGDVLTVTPPAAEGILIANPPYGVRTGEVARLEQFYPEVGHALKQRFAGWRAYLFTADLRLPKLIGLAPSRRVPLFNGPLECRLYEFKMVEGSMRKRR